MWSAINSFLVYVDDLVWGVPLMILIMAGGLLLTVRLGVMQVHKLPLALKNPPISLPGLFVFAFLSMFYASFSLVSLLISP